MILIKKCTWQMGAHCGTNIPTNTSNVPQLITKTGLFIKTPTEELWFHIFISDSVCPFVAFDS